MYVCVCKKVTETDLKNSLNKSDGNLHACQKSLGFQQNVVDASHLLRLF